MTQLNRLTENAINSLEKSMLGGIKKESAVKAIIDVAEEGSRQIEQLTKTASSQAAMITNLSQEVQEATQQLASVNAALSYTQNELATKSKKLVETTEQLTKSKSDLTNAKATKKGISKFKDGSIQEISVNKNGTRMKKIRNANGNIKSYEVEQIDGSLRKTEFDPISGIRVKTKTNTTADEVTMNYDLAGKNTNILTNAEQKPTLLKRENVNGKIVEEFSDGSKTVKSNIGKGIQIEKFDNKGNKTELYQEIKGNDANQTYHVKYGKNESIVRETYVDAENKRFAKECTISTNESGIEFISSAKYTNDNGEVIYRPTKADVKGHTTKGETITTYKVPKNADGKHVKTVKTTFDIYDSPVYTMLSPSKTNEIIITKDGSRLELAYDKDGKIISKKEYDSSRKGDCNFRIIKPMNIGCDNPDFRNISLNKIINPPLK